MTPQIKERVNSLMAGTPIKNKRKIGTKEVNVVLMLRLNVCEILELTTSLKSLPFRLFSRIRSKITIVALMEYPKMVNIQAIKVFPTESLATE